MRDCTLTLRKECKIQITKSNAATDNCVISSTINSDIVEICEVNNETTILSTSTK